MKAIFFDANGVIYYRNNGKQHFQAFLEKHGFTMPDIKELKNAMAEVNDQALRGQVSNDEYLNSILKFCGVTNPSLMVMGRDSLNRDHGDIELFSGVPDSLLELKSRGFKLGIVTDAAVSKARKLEWLKSRGIKICWDAYANSMDLGIRKPAPAMYQEALTQSAVSADEAVFVGHDRRELEGAKAIGLLTIAFNYDHDAIADFYIETFHELLSFPFLQQTDRD